MNARATLTVLVPGIHTLVVDGGRPGSRSLGVPLGGAADRFSLAIGNALVGNAPETPALEVSLVGCGVVADAPLACVLSGAPFAMWTNRRNLSAGTTFTLEPGEMLHVGGTERGCRGYLCFQGGVDAPVVLGSRSGLTPLAEGMRLSCRSATISGRWIDLDPIAPLFRPIRILPGPQADWFEEGLASEYEVTTASNRMGLRLKGKPLEVPPREMVSEPVCPGAIQVTRDGQCILLGVDGQTIGGYPKIGHVIRADLDRLGQLRPGERIAFEGVDLERAEAIWREARERLDGWLSRLGVPGRDR